MQLLPGQVIHNRYRIVKLIKQGGFGAIYRAWDLNLQKPVAIKENLETSYEAHTQFIREATMLANLSHSNLPRVTDYFTIETQGQYLVMDFVEGEDLQQMMQRVSGPLPESQVLPWFQQVCSALNYLHSQKPPIIHRDIKPANIKVKPDETAMLVDFGIAKIYDPNRKTTEGARAITPGYSPIEQYGQGSTDTRSDIYALGATLYSILTGHVPPECVERITGDQLVSPERLNPGISAATSATIMTALQVNPGQRFQKITDFTASLHTIPTPAFLPQTMQVPVQPHEAAPAYPTKTGIPKAWIGIAAGLFIIILMLLYFIWNDGLFPAAKTQDETPTHTPTATITISPTPSPEFTAVFTNTPAPANTQTFTPVPTFTPIVPTQPQPEATIEYSSPAPEGPVLFNFDSNANCRGGAGQEYELLRTINRGETKELYGKNENGDWYLIKLNDPATRKQLCWVSSSVGHFSGNQSQLATCYWVGDGYTANPQCTSP